MDDVVDTHRGSPVRGPMASVGGTSGDSGRAMATRRSLTVAMLLKLAAVSMLWDEGRPCELS